MQYDDAGNANTSQSNEVNEGYVRYAQDKDGARQTSTA
jgi:hypothetical protein